MPRKKRAKQNISDESAELKSRLEETEETLLAIRQDKIDALLVTRSNGTRVITLNEADFPYRMMVEAMNEGAVTLIPDGTIFYCNPRFGEMVQIESEQLIGTPFRNLIQPEEQDAFEALFRQAGQSSTRGEFCIRKAQGGCIPAQLSIYELENGEALGISILVTDLSERKKAEEVLQKSESLFRLIATNSPDVIFSQDRDLRYTWIVNPTSPLSAEQMVGKTDWDFLPAEQARHLTELKRGILKKGISVREELLLSPNGTSRWFDAIYQPIYDQTQQIVGIVCYARDITERVRAEEKIRSLASKLSLAEQEERQRISQILHDDLQQRLFALKAQLSVLNRINWKDQLPPGVYFDLDEIQASLSEAIAVTRNLSVDLSPVILQGKGLTDAMNWLASRMLEQHGLQVELEAKENFEGLDDNMRILLFQSVNELLFNVVKHAGTSRAKVTLQRDEQYGRITVSDAGKGFDVKRVMSASNTAHGLLVIQERLGLIGYNMEIISEPGKGAQITIKAPVQAFTS